MFFNKAIFIKNIQKGSLLEHSFGELKDAADPARKSRAGGITTFFQTVTQGQDGQARTIWEVPSQSSPGKKYTVTVAIEVPKVGLFGIAKQKWDPTKFSQVLKSANVKVHCSCKDFFWNGAKFNLGPMGKYKGSTLPINSGYSGKGYKEMDVVNEPPDIKDPNRENILCKHCIAVATNFAANSFKIMKSIRNFDVKIKVDDKATEDLSDGKTPLKKDLEFVSLDKEKASAFTEGMIHGAKQVSEEESKLQKDTSDDSIELDSSISNEIVEDPIEKESIVQEVTPEPNPIVPPTKETIVPESDEDQLEKDKIDETPELVDSNLNPVKKEQPLSKETKNVEPTEIIETDKPAKTSTTDNKIGTNPPAATNGTLPARK